MPASVWRCGAYALPLDRVLVMGILNVTPDSFSDGGRFVSADAAVEAGLALFAEGADIADVGGESTRPGAAPVTAEEELERVLPAIAALAEHGCVSVDTRHAEVARKALAAGASVVNDVSGFRDEAMREAAAGSDAGCVVMHMPGDPRTMQAEARYGDVVSEVAAYLAEQAAALEAAGVARERIAIDPGIGFGKTTEHNLELLRRLGELAWLGRPVLVGASRKRFIGEVTGVEDPAGRLAGSLTVAAWCAAHGAAAVRVHDVAGTVQTLRMLEALTSRG